MVFPEESKCKQMCRIGLFLLDLTVFDGIIDGRLDEERLFSITCLPESQVGGDCKRSKWSLQVFLSY